MRISDWSSDVCSSDLSECDIGLLAVGGDADADGLNCFRPQPGDLECDLVLDLAALIVDHGHRSADLGADPYLGIVRLELGKPRPGIDKHIVGDLVGSGIDEMGHIRSEEHTSELQSLMRISYAVFCLKKN